MGIKFGSLDASLQARVAPAASQADRIVGFPGQLAMGVLSLAAVVADGETISIGAITKGGTVVPINVFEVDPITTDTTVNTASGEWNNTNDPIKVTITAHGLAAGDLVRVENEIFKILRVLDVNTVVVARGRAGTTNAAHANALDIFKSAGPPASNIPVGFNATFTAAVAGPAFAAEINNALSGAERATAKASTIYPYLGAASLLSGAEVVVYGKEAGVISGALAETLAGANNAWTVASLGAGRAAGFKRVFASARVPVALEVTIGQMEFLVPFQPAVVAVTVLTTATGIEVAWNGARFIVQLEGSLYRVTLDNSGLTDWATTTTVYVRAFE